MITRGINLDIFTDVPPYSIQRRITDAATQVKASWDHGWLFFNRAQANAIAGLVNKGIKEGDGNVFLTGDALWALAPLELRGSKKLMRSPP